MAGPATPATVALKQSTIWPGSAHLAVAHHVEARALLVADRRGGGVFQELAPVGFAVLAARHVLQRSQIPARQRVAPEQRRRQQRQAGDGEHYRRSTTSASGAVPTEMVPSSKLVAASSAWMALAWTWAAYSRVPSGLSASPIAGATRNSVPVTAWRPASMTVILLSSPCET